MATPSVGQVHAGFTLIELLVVIALIGLLSSVALASMGPARSKGVDARIESELHSLQLNAELYYQKNRNTYGPVYPSGGSCTTALTMFVSATDPNIKQIITDLDTQGGATRCYASVSGYAAGHVLTASTPTQYFCVDSIGHARASATAVNSVVCP